jgi:hypothetical protein
MVHINWMGKADKKTSYDKDRVRERLGILALTFQEPLSAAYPKHWEDILCLHSCVRFCKSKSSSLQTLTNCPESIDTRDSNVVLVSNIANVHPALEISVDELRMEMGH